MPEWKYEMANQPQTLAYRDNYSGNHRVVILLHGLGVDSQSWYFQEEALGKAGYRPVIPDLPGFGKSLFDPKKWSVDVCARILTRFAKELSDEPKILVGISLGGAIAIKMLADHPEKYSKAILINSFTQIKPKNTQNTIFLATRIFKAMLLSIEDQATFMASRLFPSDEDAPFRQMIIDQIKATNPKIYKRALVNIGLLNYDEYLKRIATPCLVITGANDSTILPESQARMAKMIKNSLQIVIPEAGHAVIVQKPDQVNCKIMKFLQD